MYPCTERCDITYTSEKEGLMDLCLGYSTRAHKIGNLNFSTI